MTHLKLTEIEYKLDHELAFVRAQATVDGGWRRVVERYQLQLPCPARPTVRDLCAVVHHLCMRALAALDELGPPPSESLALLGRLGQLVEVEGRAYDEALRARAPVSRLLGNLFHNATASVDDQPWAAFRWQERIVAKCKTCGAPQQVPSNYRCGYCGGDMFKRIGSER
ncbi:MAG: hypothetical protein AB7P03_07260 [Kofleriaceae bacterium]